MRSQPYLDVDEGCGSGEEEEAEVAGAPSHGRPPAGDLPRTPDARGSFLRRGTGGRCDRLTVGPFVERLNGVFFFEIILFL